MRKHTRLVILSCGHRIVSGAPPVIPGAVFVADHGVFGRYQMFRGTESSKKWMCCNEKRAFAKVG